MNKVIVSFVYCITGLIVLSGCSATMPKTQSGFIDDYEYFSPLNGDTNTLVYSDPSFNAESLRSYQKVYVAPVELWLDGNGTHSVNPIELTYAAHKFTQSLRTMLQQHYTLVATPQDDTLEIRAAITRIKFGTPQTNALDFIPFRIVMNAGNAVYLNATGQSDIITQVSLEAEFVSEQKRVFAISATKSLEDSLADNGEDNINAIQDVLNVWVTNFDKRLRALKN